MEGALLVRCTERSSKNERSWTPPYIRLPPSPSQMVEKATRLGEEVFTFAALPLHSASLGGEVGFRFHSSSFPFILQITQLKIASNPFAKGFRDCDPEEW